MNWVPLEINTGRIEQRERRAECLCHLNQLLLLCFVVVVVVVVVVMVVGEDLDHEHGTKPNHHSQQLHQARHVPDHLPLQHLKHHHVDDGARGDSLEYGDYHLGV